jgi:hypothetical protein
MAKLQAVEVDFFNIFARLFCSKNLPPFIANGNWHIAHCLENGAQILQIQRFEAKFW